MATYLHPDKIVSVERVLARKKARKRVATINKPKNRKPVNTSEDNLVRNLAAHLMTVNQARG